MIYRKDSKYFFLLTQGRSVERIDEFESFEDYKTNSKYFEKEYDNYKIFVYDAGSGNTCPYKIGDYVPANNDYACLMLKNKGSAIKRTKYEPLVNKDAELEAQFKYYVESLTQDKINQAKTTLIAHQQNEELAYRAIYHSFKMYKAKLFTIDFAIEMLNLMGFEASQNDHPYEILDKFKKANFDFKLIALFEDVIEVFFYLERNDLNYWKVDMQIMFSAYHLFEKHLEFLVKISQDILDQKGILFSGTTLNWHEAGAMTAWEPLGLYRGRNRKEIQDLLVSKKNQ